MSTVSRCRTVVPRASQGWGPLALTGFGLLAAPSRRLRAAALLPAIIGAAVVLPLLPPRFDDAYVPDRGTLSAPAAQPDQPDQPHQADR